MEDTKQDIDIKVETEEDVKTKRCSKCGRILPLSEFYRDKYRKDGKRSICMDCVKLKRKEYCKSHREEVHKSQAKWRAKHPNYEAEYKTEWYKANKEHVKEYNSAYNAIYYDPLKYPIRWARMIVKNYRSTDKSKGFDPSQTISAEWFLDNIAYKPCAHCGKQGIGLIGCNRLYNTKGHTIDNVEPCCPSCNFSQNIRDQLARGVHISQLRKKQSFKEFVNAHKAKDKNLS